MNQSLYSQKTPHILSIVRIYEKIDIVLYWLQSIHKKYETYHNHGYRGLGTK